MIAEYYRVPKVLFVANDVGENGSERFNIEKKICRDFVYKHFMRRVLYDSADWVKFNFKYYSHVFLEPFYSQNKQTNKNCAKFRVCLIRTITNGLISRNQPQYSIVLTISVLYEKLFLELL